MSILFDPSLRDQIATNLAGFAVEKLPSKGLKRAAVALTIVDNDQEKGAASVLLTRRTARLNSHARQWALPGGRVDAGETAFEAAVREMHEEVNLQLGPEQFLGRLDDVQSRSGYVISPFVFWGEDIRMLNANPDEVASIHHIPLYLFGLDNAIQFIDQAHTETPLLRLQLGENRIHAPTGAFLLQLWEVAIQGRQTRVGHYAHPEWAK